MTRSLAASLLVAVWIAAGAARAQPRPCRAELETEPSRPYVGQEVLWRLRITHLAGASPTLDTQPSFPDFRAEWLPSRELDEAPSGPPVHEERRALFPALAGRLALPAVRIRCPDAGGGSRVAVPRRMIEVRAAPEANRPAGWKGLVGPVRLSVLVSPETVAVGEALRVSVEIEGAANVWDAASPLDRIAGPTRAEVFRHPPELARDVGERLVLRRYFTYDVVPRRPGRLVVPELRVPWLDPEQGIFRVARAGPFPVRVLPAPPPEHGEAPGGRAANPPAPPPGLGRGAGPEESGGGSWRWPVVGAAGLLLAAWGALLFAHRRRSPAARRSAHLERAMRAARAAEARGDVAGAATAVARGIRRALAGFESDAAALSAEELLSASRDGNARDLARLLARAEQLRFSPDAGEPALRELLAALEERAAPGGGEASR